MFSKLVLAPLCFFALTVSGAHLREGAVDRQLKSKGAGEVGFEH